jgi:uncharacterized RDD family membrane protein YckC
LTGHVSPVPREARPYQGRRAGIVTRTIASAVDFLVGVALVAGGYFGFAGFLFVLRPRSFQFPEVPVGALLPILLAVLGGYLALGWWTTGRTYGGQLMGLRVQTANGQRLGLGIASLRAVFYVLFPLGLFWVPFSPDNRSIQDLVLRTAVVYDWEPKSMRRGS